MLDYFILQFRMTNRRFKDAGLDPVFAWPLSIAVFMAFSLYLFYKTEFAEYAYMFISISLTAGLSETGRTEFIGTCFKSRHASTVRILENLAVAAPFLLFLLYKQLFTSAVLLAAVTIMFAFSGFRTRWNIAIPTPFYKRPFEFAVGFRNTFFLFPAAYILTGIAVSVDNFYLGVFSMLFIFFVTLGYYVKPENKYFIWTFNLTAKQFLLEKIKTALLYSSLLVAPTVLILMVFYVQNTGYLLLFLLAGYAFLVGMILAKYAAYPDELGVFQGIILALCLYFPPILILVIPYFFSKSTIKIRHLLR